MVDVNPIISLRLRTVAAVTIVVYLQLRLYAFVQFQSAFSDAYFVISNVDTMAHCPLPSLALNHRNLQASVASVSL